MISALVPGSSGPASIPGRGRHCVVFLGCRHLTLTVPLSKVYNWVPANLRLGGEVEKLIVASC